MKLTKAQQNTIHEITSVIENAKKCDNAEMYILEQYSERKKCFSKAFTLEKYIENYGEADAERWNMAQTNKMKGFFNSSTLKALEKAGLIKISIDGKDNIDIIELI